MRTTASGAASTARRRASPRASRCSPSGRTTATMSGCLQEHQPAVAVVVGERAERLGPQGDLRVELQWRVERDGHGGVDRSAQ